MPTLTKSDAIDAALCHGWINGQLDRYDDHHWLIRFTPRKPRSKWSEINRTLVNELAVPKGCALLASVRSFAEAVAGTPVPTIARGRRAFSTWLYNQAWHTGIVGTERTDMRA